MNPQKLNIPLLEEYLARLKRKRDRINEIITDYETDIERRKALPD